MFHRRARGTVDLGTGQYIIASNVATITDEDGSSSTEMSSQVADIFSEADTENASSYVPSICPVRFMRTLRRSMKERSIVESVDEFDNEDIPSHEESMVD